MVKNLWDKESKTLFKKYYREYKSEGYEDREAKRLSKQDVNTVLGERIDFAELLYKSTLETISTRGLNTEAHFSLNFCKLSV